MKRRQCLAVLGATAISGCNAIGALDSDGESTSSVSACPDNWGWQYQGDSANQRTVKGMGDTGGAPSVDVLLTDPSGAPYDYAMAAFEGVGCLASDRAVKGYDLESGGMLWEKSVSSNVATAPLIGCGAAFVQMGRKTEAFDLRTGEKRWKADHGSLNWTPLVVDSGYLYSLGPKEVRRFDPESGASQGVYDHSGLLLSISISDGRIYATGIGEGETQGVVYAVDMESGEEVWRREGFRCRSPPTVVNGTVYVVTKDATVVAMSVDDGSVRWTKGISGSQTYESPVVGPDGDSLYVATGKGGSVAALNTSNGEIQWETTLKLPNVASNPPVVTEDTVIVGANGVFGLNAETGEKRWNVSEGPVDTPFRRYEDSLITIQGESVIRLSW